MKRLIVPIVAVLACMVACTDENIGSSLNDTRSVVIEDSSFTITGSSVSNAKVQSRTLTQLLGRISDAAYGTLTSEVVTQLMPALAIDTLNVTTETIDSCKLLLRIPASGGFTGDSLVPMRLAVYRLTKQLPSPIYSDFNPEGYYDASHPLAECAYSAATTTIGLYNTSTSTTYLELAVPMPVSIAKEMFNAYRKAPKQFASPKAFAELFPGFYIATSYGTGRVMNFTDTSFKTYYRRILKSSTGTDSIVDASQVYAAATPEVISNNVIRLDVAPAIKSAINAGQTIVMTPAGYELQVRFPLQEIIASYKSRIEGDLAMINSLSLELPVEEIKNSCGIAPPSHLLIVKTCKKDQFIAGNSLANDQDSFYAAYDAAHKRYTFDEMRDYIIDVIKNKGGVASEDDINLTIMPIDVTTYTNQSSYYSSGSTVTTKMAPAVMKPSMARIRLDKAKVKIVYNRQDLL